MRTFKVFTHPARSPQAVKVGFSWPALLFGLFWLMYHRLWRWGFLSANLQLINLVLDKALKEGRPTVFLAVSGAVIGVVIFVFWLIIGFYGNQWREAALLRRGYVLVDTVQAEMPEGALAVVLEKS